MENIESHKIKAAISYFGLKEEDITKAELTYYDTVYLEKGEETFDLYILSSDEAEEEAEAYCERIINDLRLEIEYNSNIEIDKIIDSKLNSLFKHIEFMDIWSGWEEFRYEDEIYYVSKEQ